MLTRLETTHFLAVIGPSGSGKSSLVFAGLIPGLREGQLAGTLRTPDGPPASELFSGLPELVSASQFITPRLNRKQREKSLAGPARVMGWEIAPDALNALLNDCGNSPDQLPLAQHVQRRM